MYARLLLICLAGGWITPAVLGEKSGILVVSLGGVDAYLETVQGIREQVPDAEVMDAQQEGPLRARLHTEPPSLAIAVGSDAAALLDRVAPPQLATLKSVLLETDVEHPGSQRGPASAITVEMDPSALLAELRRLFPDKTHLGVIRGPLQTEEYIRNIEQAAHRLGFTLEVRNCAEARELVKVFLEFQSTDFVWCLPNPQLYNSATLKPLLIASVTRRMPLIGFSLQFVEAGALFGGAPDFREVGRQTGRVALRLLRHEAVPPRIEARAFRFAYNQRVARLIGVKAAAADRPAAQLDIIR